MVLASTQENNLEGLLMNKITKLQLNLYNQSLNNKFIKIILNYLYILQGVKLIRNMNRVRISKKNPNKILRTLQMEPQSKKIINPHDTHTISKNQGLPSKNINFRRKSLEIKSLINSNRYKNSSPDESNLSYRQNNNLYKQRIVVSSEKQDLRNTNTELKNSPYLYSNRYSARETQQQINRDSSFSKQKRNSIQLKSIRKKRSNSEEIQKNITAVVFEEAKKLLQLGENNKSIYILKNFLKEHPSNPDAYYLLCLNFYNLGDFSKVINVGQSILKNCEFPNLHLIVAKSYSHLNDTQNYLKKLNECEEMFPQNQIIYLEKVRYYDKQNDKENSKKYLSLALEINPVNFQGLEKLINLSNNCELQGILKQLKQLQFRGYHKKNEKLKELFCLILFKQKKYQQLINLFEKSTNSQILYHVAYSHFILQDSPKANLLLQSCLIDCEKPAKFIKLMLALKIRESKFYQAMHLIERIKKFQIKTSQIEVEVSFVNGVFNLIRRNIKQGINQLRNIIQLFQHAEISEQICLLQIFKTIHSFLAYGYYCQGEYEKCQRQYEIQAKKFPEIFIQFIEYNRNMNKAIWLCSTSQLEESLHFFLIASQINPNRLEPYLCLAVTNFKLGYKMKDSELLQKARTNFDASLQHITKIHHNSASFVFFFKSVFHIYMEEWRDAIMSIDQTIDRAEQNYWKHYYIRAIIFAKIHNFEEALNDVSIAINLKKNVPELYLLRASCFQIEGYGSNALKDLQFYISYQPDDYSIHKFAGKLLFQNGAFEDALKAFNHADVQRISENFDVFLTKSKTYFLLGQFAQAAFEMNNIFQICPQKKYLNFDSKMMNIIADLIDEQSDKKMIMETLEKLYGQNFDSSEKNYIFKQTQLHTLKGVCFFQLNQIEQAIKCFQSSMKAKHKIVVRETLLEGSNRQDQKDTRIYLSQMKFNIALCYLKLGNIQSAQQYLLKMQIHNNQLFYKSYCQFTSTFNKNYEIKLDKEEEVKKIEVFPNKNKISHYLRDFSYQIHSNTFYSKLCIPFPKVQPPQIFPTVDPKIFEQLTAEKVQKKPEAPWIVREKNSINFTGKIQRYSRLQIEEDEEGPNSSVQFSTDNSHISIQSLSSRKVKIQINQNWKDQINLKQFKLK